MKIIRFQKFILEQNQEEKTINMDDIKQDLIELVEKSLSTSDEKTKKDFISAYLQNSEKNQIEGLINDSDIYEFYLKHRNSIDSILANDDFFENKPSELNSFSLYDYIIVGTTKCIKTVLQTINKSSE